MRRSKKSIGLVMLTALLAMVWTGKAELPELQVGQVDSTPLIDGRLDDKCWQREPDIPEFLRVGGKGETMSPLTRVWTAHDDRWFFIAFACEEPEVAEIEVAPLDRDGRVFREESVEVFVSPGTDSQTYQHFSLTIDNVQADNRGEVVSGKRHIPWDAHWRSGTARDPEAGRWTAEMAIPLFYLTRDAGSDRWRFNVCRSKWHGERMAGSWALLSASYHDSERFGVLKGLADVQASPVFAPVIAEAAIGNMTDLPERGYEVVADIKNHGKTEGNVVFTAADVTEQGVRWTAPQSVPLSGGHGTKVKAWVRFEEYQPRSSLAKIAFEDALGAYQFTRPISWERSQEPFGALMDRSYYTTEEDTYLVYHSPLAASVLKACRVRVRSELLDADVVADDVQPSGRIRLPLDLKEAGTWQVQAVLELADGKALKEVTCDVVRRKPSPAGNTVKIDRWRRCVLLNGEPVFPYGFYRAWPENYTLMSRCGATAAVVWRPMEHEDLLAALDEAQRNGMYLFTSPIPHATWKYGNDRTAIRLEATANVIDTNLEELLRPVAAHPAMLAYHLWDEPHRTAAVRDGLKALHDALHELDGYHPTSTGDYIILEKDPVWLDIIDVAFPHHYWLPTGVEKRVDRRYLARLREIRNASRELMKPVWFGMVNEFHSVTRRMMTERERRLNVYLTLIHEITGLYYFAWPAAHVNTHAAILGIRQELDLLRPALFMRTPAQSYEVVNGDEDSVQALLKPHPDGGGVLLAANPLKTGVEVTFDVAGLEDGVMLTSLFDSAQTFAVNADGWSDRLEAYGVRAYRIPVMPSDGAEIAIRATITNSDEVRAGLDDRTGAGNLVSNPGFEDAADWSGIEGQVGVTLDSGFARSGDRSLRLVRTDADAMPLRVLSAPLVLRPNSRYRIGAWVYGDIQSAPKKWGGPNISVQSETVDGYRLNLQTHAHHIEGRWSHRTGHLDTGPEPETIRLMVSAGRGKYTGTVWVDDLHVEALALEASRNLLPNSGFEHATAPGYPDRWAGGLSSKYLSEETLTPRPDALLRQDDAEHVEGACSVRLRGYIWFNSAPTRANRGVRLNSDTDYVFSCFMKADREDYRVRFNSVDKERHYVNVGTEWQRYHWVVHTPKTSARLHVTLLPIGSMRYDGPAEDMPVLWIDAAQFEKGTEPTEYVPDAYNLADPSWMSLE